MSSELCRRYSGYLRVRPRSSTIKMAPSDSSLGTGDFSPDGCTLRSRSVPGGLVSNIDSTALEAASDRLLSVERPRTLTWVVCREQRVSVSLSSCADPGTCWSLLGLELRAGDCETGDASRSHCSPFSIHLSQAPAFRTMQRLLRVLQIAHLHGV